MIYENEYMNMNIIHLTIISKNETFRQLNNLYKNILSATFCKCLHNLSTNAINIPLYVAIHLKRHTQ